MDEKSKQWGLTYKIATVILLALVLSFSAVNLYAQIPFLRYAVDTGEGISSTIDRINLAMNGRIFGYEAPKNLHAEILTHLHKKESRDFQVVQGEEGYLQIADFYTFDINDYSYAAITLEKLSQAVAENGGALLYINPIDRSIGAQTVENNIPLEDNKYRYDAIDFYLEGFGVPTLNLDDVFRQAETSRDARFRTDTHWTIPTSFAAFVKIVEKLRDVAGIDLDPLGFYTDLDHYQQIVYTDRFLGNQGQLAGLAFSGYEDFTLIAPAFTTSFVLTIDHFDGEVTLRGRFAETMLATRYLEAESEYERMMYRAYLGGDAPHRVIQNENNPYGPKILVISDTYMYPVITFLACTAGEVHTLWPYENPVVEDLGAYLEDERFDIVLIALASHTMTEGGFGFLRGFE